MSKPVFAYAAMKLCEKGVLDTPLTKYTSDRFLQGDPRLDLITARHVLSHTAGFQNWRSEEQPLKIHFTPGAKYFYSGEGYNYLQTVITHLAGQAIEPYMQANLFRPFGMASSGYVWNDLFEKHSARPHDADGNPFAKNKPTPATATRYAAAGELHSTPTDYAKFLIEVIDPKESDAFRLTKNNLREMLRPQVKVTDSSSWALGWHIHHGEKHDVITHGGDNKGFHAFAAASVDGKWAYVVMTNGDGGVQLLNKIITGDVMQRIFNP
jgi:CubicO group peptidase (beta-lactamase class C family)